ncbi:MAG: response regulator transcription factor [Nitrospira sp.]|nr:MAG: response regulator transcription factor [Nitrospira sp.]
MSERTSNGTVGFVLHASDNLHTRNMDLSRTNIKPVRVFIVDDYEIVRAGLRAMLSRQDGISVVGEAATVTEAIGGSSRLKPDVVLMDIQMLSDSGVDACRAIRDSCPHTRVLFLSSYEDDEAVLAAVLAGISGYLVKQVNAEELLQARTIQAVAQGQSILDPTVTQPLLTRMPVQREISKPLQTTLSIQQQRVLELIAQGKTNKEIGSSLDLSDQTVKNYIRFIFRKLNVTRRAHAAALFTRYSSAGKRSADDHTHQ